MLPAQVIAQTKVIPASEFEYRPPHIGETQSGQISYARLKRLADILFVIVAAPGILLVIGLAAIAIALTMGRPIFFFNERVGRNGHIFKMVKLRTMTNGGGKVYNAT